MGYCPPQYLTLNGTRTVSGEHDVWVDNAFDICIFDTTTAMIMLLIMGVCGYLELRSYFRHGDKVDSVMMGSPPLLYMIQIGLSLGLSTMSVIRFILQVTQLQFYPFMLVHFLIGTSVWAVSALIMYVERNYDLPTLPRGRHSIYLLVFWALALLIDSLYLVNVAGSEWYFAMKSTQDIVLVALFIIQWLSELTLLVLGTRAPGILTNKQRSKFIYSKLNNGEEQGFGYGSTTSRSDSIPSHSLPINGAFEQSVDALRCQLENGDLVEQFRRMPRQSNESATSIGREPQNESLNRYFNVLPYDESRVVLKDTVGDYINASWVTQSIPDMDMTNIYIAAQMIIAERVPLIVMLTELNEQGAAKCVQYWPELNETLQLGDGLILSCNHVKMARNKNYTIRDLFVYNERTGDSFTVTHCHMHAWPDHSAPKTNKKLLDFHRAVNARSPSRRVIAETSESLSPPILVHCSAGVGRTGTYILMETLLACVDAQTPLRPLDVVLGLRRQRMAMVQTDDQLVSACEAALQYYDTIKNRQR